MSQISGGLTSAGMCLLMMFPQVTALSDVGQCHGELTGRGLFVPTLCPPAYTPKGCPASQTL